MWAHLWADDLEELHAFAKKLGLKRAWFQDKRLKHYDVTANKRLQALKLGAISKSLRQKVREDRERDNQM